MRLREFFERLPKDGWLMVGHYGDRIRMPSLHCPVCAVDRSPNIVTDYTTAAAHLGLPQYIARRIAHAADNEAWGERRPMTPTERRIRRLLLAHCGLTEPQ